MVPPEGCIVVVNGRHSTLGQRVETVGSLISSVFVM